MTQIFGEGDGGIEAILAGDAIARERSREYHRRRHARETTALAAAVMRANREGVRKAKKLNQIDPALTAEVQAGSITLDAAYRRAVGDTRVGLYLKLDAQTDADLREAAADLDLSPQRLVADLIDRFLTNHRAERNGWVL